MKKTLLILLNVYVAACCMEQESLDVTLYKNVPREVQDVIRFYAQECEIKKAESKSPGLLPTTLMPLTLKHLISCNVDQASYWRAAVYNNALNLVYMVSRSTEYNKKGELETLESDEIKCHFDGTNSKQFNIMSISDEKKNFLYVLYRGRFLISDPNYATEIYEKYLVEKDHCILQRIQTDSGRLTCLLLHPEDNICVRGIKNNYTDQDKPHCIQIGTLSCKERLYTETDGGTQQEIVPLHKVQFLYNHVASCNTDFILKKAVYIGKDTHLGVTQDGQFISFWTDNYDCIHYAKQTCNNKQFKHIAVDRTYKTATGFMPRIALMSNKGELYLSDIQQHQTPTLYYARTLPDVKNIHRLIYEDGNCGTLYRIKTDFYKDDDYGIQCRVTEDSMWTWPENIEMLQSCALLKKGLQISNQGENDVA